MNTQTAKLGESKIIEHFRPRLFKQIDRSQTSLKLDLFWPIPIDGSDETPVIEDNDSDDDTCNRYAFPYDGLQPLTHFRCLRVLHITGMMQSYQPYIWPVVWANDNLAILHLEMAIPPLFNLDTTHQNRVIDSRWSCFPVAPSDVYLGEGGSGYLNEEFGSGEYFDSLAIRNALMTAHDGEMMDGQYRRFLSIRQLSLMNFVVDGHAFETWFDPSKLTEISFKGECIDAGFYLHESMSSVTLQKPGPNIRPVDIAHAVRFPSRTDIDATRRELTASPAESKKYSPSNKLKEVKAAIKEKLGHGKENKNSGEQQSVNSDVVNDSNSSGSVVIASPVDASAYGMVSCFGGGFATMETLFNSVEIEDASDYRNNQRPSKN